jgi:hypothetical protein
MKIRKKATLIKSIIVIVALGVISYKVSVKFLSLSECLGMHYPVRVVGSAINASIQTEHSDYLINGTDYTASSAVAGTSFTDGIKVTTGVPGEREISAVSPTTIRLNYKNKIYEWDYIPRNGKIAAYMVENTDSDF